MLTFEWDKNSERLEIHTNAAGLRELLDQLNKLANLEGNQHVHLMTKAWGGEELSSEKQNLKAESINHVNIFKWED